MNPQPSGDAAADTTDVRRFVRAPARLRRQRCNDFRRRARYAPESVYRHRLHDWEYIPVHPFADETELLRRLELQPDACRRVDAWCAIDGDVALLTCEGTPGSRAPHYRALRPRFGSHLHLHAAIDAPQVTRAEFEAAMTSFWRAGFPRARRFALRRGAAAVDIDSDSAAPCAAGT